MSTATAIKKVHVGEPPAAAPAQLDAERMSVRALAFLVAPLLALIVVIRHFGIESKAFANLAVLAFSGFLVHYFLPLRYRLPFFGLLSLAGIGLVLGVGQAAWIVGIGA